MATETAAEKKARTAAEKELKALTARATELGIDFTEATPLSELKDLVSAKEAEGKTVEVTVTQEMFDAMPELSTNGIKVGDLVAMPEAEAAPFMKEKPAQPAAPSGKGAMAVLKGNEYIRTYGKDQKDELDEFLSKKGAEYTAVPDDSIDEVEVTYEVKGKDGVISRPAQRFSDKAAAILFKNEHRSTCIVVPNKK